MTTNYRKRIEQAAACMGARDAAVCPSGAGWVFPSGRVLCVRSASDRGHIGIAQEVELAAGLVPRQAKGFEPTNDSIVRFWCDAGAIRVAGGTSLTFGRKPTPAQLHAIRNFWRQADRPTLYVDAVDCGGTSGRDRSVRLPTPSALADWVSGIGLAGARRARRRRRRWPVPLFAPVRSEGTDPRQQRMWPTDAPFATATWWPRKRGGLRDGDVIARYRKFNIVVVGAPEFARHDPTWAFTLAAVDRETGKRLGFLHTTKENALPEVRRLLKLRTSWGNRPTAIRVTSAFLENDVPLGSGIGTRLYEAAYKVACREHGAPMLSDWHGHRTEYSDGFWRKQARKKRATCVAEDESSVDEGAGECAYYALPCPAGSLTGARARRRTR